MQTKTHPIKQGQQFGTACLQQPGYRLMSLLNLIPTEPFKNKPDITSQWRFVFTDVNGNHSGIHSLGRYAEPLPYHRLSVSLRLRISERLHVCVYSCARVDFTLGHNPVYAQDAEKLFFWNPQTPPTSKFEKLLEASKKGGVQ